MEPSPYVETFPPSLAFGPVRLHEIIDCAAVIVNYRVVSVVWDGSKARKVGIRQVSMSYALLHCQVYIFLIYISCWIVIYCDDKGLTLCYSCDNFMVPHKDCGNRVQHHITGGLGYFECATVQWRIESENRVSSVVDGRQKGEEHCERAELFVTIVTGTLMAVIKWHC